MAVRAVRGATTVEADEREQVLQVTTELMAAILAENGLVPDDFISVIFSATPDIASVAPALGVRQRGFEHVALLCVQEMAVTGSLPLTVRILAHVNTDRTNEQISNVYLRGTHVLRAEPQG